MKNRGTGKSMGVYEVSILRPEDRDWKKVREFPSSRVGLVPEEADRVGEYIRDKVKTLPDGTLIQVTPPWYREDHLYDIIQFVVEGGEHTILLNYHGLDSPYRSGASSDVIELLEEKGYGHESINSFLREAKREED